jgi:unsaturated rhamnogalacturonyl hydrolase
VLCAKYQIRFSLFTTEIALFEEVSMTIGRPTCVFLCSVAAVFGITTAASAALATYEAESATIFRGGFENTHAGFTGTGYVNLINEVGSYVEWSVSASQSAPASLTLRFANGTTADRRMDVSVNGVVVASSLSFPGTGAWTTWRTQPVSAMLNLGTNTVRVTSLTADGGPNLDRLDVDDSGTPTPTPTATATPTATPVGGTDWGRKMVDSTMTRKPSPSDLGTWEYSRALFLWGEYLVWQRTRDPRYLQYIKNWVDSKVSSDGTLNASIPRLDNVLPGNLLIAMYRETGLAKYKTAATTVRKRFDTYPRTSDGGFLHQTSSTMKGELWADGTYMALPFLLRYGQTFNDATYTNDETSRQIAIYSSHLKASNGLLYHAYDEDGSVSWDDPTTHHSKEFWCRATGWFGMSLVEELEVLPETHPRRAAVLANLQSFVAGLVRYQDPATGRWFQVMDKGSMSDNWTETSCSAMHTYVISRAVQRGYVSSSYAPNAAKGFQGVLAKISLGTDGLTNLRDVCVGTDVGSYSYYIGRTRATNDLHGLGAFLIMYEQLRANGGT